MHLVNRLLQTKPLMANRMPIGILINELKTFITMKKLLFILPFLALVACGAKQENVEEESSESKHLSFWWQKHDSINHAFVMTAEPIWQFGRNGEDMYDWSYQDKWHKACRQVLINMYDSIHPGEKAKGKDIRMVDELQEFFTKEPDYSTMGVIISYDLSENFVMYKTIAKTKDMITWKRKRNVMKEVNAWNKFHRYLNKFCVNMLYLGWYGGSGAGPACTALVCNISNTRLKDVERMNKLYHKQLSLSQLLYKDILGMPFEAAVDSVIKNRRLSPNAREWYSEYQCEGYENQYNETVALRDSLIDAYTNWISVREELFGLDNHDSQKDMMISDVCNIVLMSGED